MDVLVRTLIGISVASAAGFCVLGAARAPAFAASRADMAPAVVRTASPAPASRPAALEELRPGLWSIHADGPGALPRRICLDDPAKLVQVRHSETAACSRMVIASAAHEATIHYSCPGAGWGRTSLRVDSATSVRIDTQGIADNAPFAYQATARREGECPTALR